MVWRMRWRSWWLGVATIGVGMALLPQQVAANGGYPYADMPCIHAPYAIWGKGARWCFNYDWGKYRDSTRAASVISPYDYYYRNCTDYVAWKLAARGVPAERYRGLGNAKQWARPPAGHGLRVDSQPAAGAAGVRISGQYGHVAFVETVDVLGYPAGSIRISEYNKKADGTYGERTGTPAQLGLTHFVHFEDYMPLPAAPPTLQEPPALNAVALQDGRPATPEPPAASAPVRPDTAAPTEAVPKSVPLSKPVTPNDAIPAPVSSHTIEPQALGAKRPPAEPGVPPEAPETVLPAGKSAAAQAIFAQSSVTASYAAGDGLAAVPSVVLSAVAIPYQRQLATVPAPYAMAATEVPVPKPENAGQWAVGGLLGIVLLQQLLCMPSRVRP